MTTKRDPPQDLDRPAATTEGVQDLGAAPAKRQGAQDLDPHLAERLHQLRRDLGLSVEEMAARVGLWGANGADNLRQMERCKRPIPGTLQVLMGHMERDQLIAAGRISLEGGNGMLTIRDHARLWTCPMGHRTPAYTKPNTCPECGLSPLQQLP